MNKMSKILSAGTEGEGWIVSAEKKYKFVSSILIGVSVALGLRTAHAHAFGERYDLPVPLSIFLLGGIIAVVLSFAVIGITVRGGSKKFTYHRYNILRSHWVCSQLLSRISLIIVRPLSFTVFVLVIASSLFGSSKPLENFSPTFVWIIWWVGMGYISTLVGNVWILVNPWKIVIDCGEKFFGGGRNLWRRGIFRYPEGLDTWPAVAFFFVFAWVENVYQGSVDPRHLGIILAIYSVITWAGMLAFGKYTWIRYCEVFSVLFSFFSRFSPTEVRVRGERWCKACELGCNVFDNGCVDCYQCYERADGQQRELNIRPYAVGLANPVRVSTATAVFVILVLSTVTLDGFQETSSWFSLQARLLSATSVMTVEVIDTLGLVVVPFIFILFYLGFSWTTARLSGDSSSVIGVAKAFVFSLVPIALAYNIAHYISLLAIQGQLIVPLISDPFGIGWDIFHSSDYRLNLNIINAKFVWFVSVVAIVLGHISSVYIGHIISIGRGYGHRASIVGQLPMLVLMVLYTFSSLWIVAQPIVEG